MSIEFQTVVKKNVSRDERSSALDRLVASGEHIHLAVLVQTDGLAGEFRRQALDGLIRSGGTEQLDALAEDRSIPRSLRRRAGEAA